MEFLENNPKVAIYIVSAIVGIAVIIGGIAWSAGTVEPVEFGLKYNSISKSIDDSSTYVGGWYLIGPFNSFITYPSTNINVDFSYLPNSKSPPLSTRSGGNHTVLITIFIRIPRDTLILFPISIGKGRNPSIVQRFPAELRI